MELTFNGQIEPGYIKEVKDILENREFMQLGAISHHQSTSRLMHSINVSYISWHIARKLGCDARMAARAGLLHDFCLYDFKEKPPTGGFQAFYHPRVAARNSQEVFGISEREKSAILSHMFPLGPVPKNREAWIITMADKICASMEYCHIYIALERGRRVVVAANNCSFQNLGYRGTKRTAVTKNSGGHFFSPISEYYIIPHPGIQGINY